MPNCRLCCPPSKIETKRKERLVPEPCEGIEKTVESDGDTNCNWCSYNSHQRISTRTEGLGNKRMSGDHPNYGNSEIGQNTEKSPEDLSKLAVTQTSVKKPSAKFGMKNSRNNNNNWK